MSVIERRKRAISERAYLAEKNIEVLVKLKQVRPTLNSTANLERVLSNKGNVSFLCSMQNVARNSNI